MVEVLAQDASSQPLNSRLATDPGGIHATRVDYLGRTC